MSPFEVADYLASDRALLQVERGLRANLNRLLTEKAIEASCDTSLF